MDLSKMSPQEARAIVMQAQNVFDASIADQQRSSPKEIQSLPIDLSEGRSRENAIKVSFPFKSVLVEQADDLNTFIYLIPISNESGNDPIRLGLKDIYKNEFGFRECYIYWDAQAGKKVLLKFFVRSFLENGRLLLDQNSQYSSIDCGGASAVNDGYTILLKSTFETLGTTGSFNDAYTAIFTGVNTTEFDTGTIYDTSSNEYKTFRVPMGYTAEIIGIEMVVPYEIPTASWRCQWREEDDGLIYDAGNIYVADYTSGLQKLSVNRVYPANVNPVKVYDAQPIVNWSVPRVNRKFKEGKILVFLCRTNTNGGATKSIQTEFYTLLRLTKNVG